MYSFNIKDQVDENIDIFIDKYLEGFLSIFTDSWISNLYLIEQNYYKTAEVFRDKIYDAIFHVFSWDIIWKYTWDGGEYYTIVSVWNFKLFIEYSEDVEKQIRYIEHIEFHKK